MCGMFTPTTFDEAQAVARALNATAGTEESPAENASWPRNRRGNAATHALPRRVVPVVCAAQEGENDDGDAGGFEARALTWGYVPKGQTDLVFNTRIETASELELWRESLERRRCLVCAWNFFEAHRKKEGVNPATGKVARQRYRFSSPDGSLLVMAGIWQDDRFSIMTTLPNASVRPVHDRMPVVLSPKEIWPWLDGDRDGLANRDGIELTATPEFPPAPSHEQLSLF